MQRERTRRSKGVQLLEALDEDDYDEALRELESIVRTYDDLDEESEAHVEAFYARFR